MAWSRLDLGKFEAEKGRSGGLFWARKCVRFEENFGEKIRQMAPVSAAKLGTEKEATFGQLWRRV